MANSVKIKCRKCNRLSSADEFVLDPFEKMMICPLCVKDGKGRMSLNKKKEDQEKVKKEEAKNKPVGWDHDDDYLERMHKIKQGSPAVEVERIDKERVKYTCFNCKYRFVYNLVTKHPTPCPYCGAAIAKMK